MESQNAKNSYLDKLIDPGFEGVNRLFVLSFQNSTDGRSYRENYFPNV